MSDTSTPETTIEAPQAPVPEPTLEPQPEPKMYAALPEAAMVEVLNYLGKRPFEEVHKMLVPIHYGNALQRIAMVDPANKPLA
jgi:hypothetical protein